MDSKTLSYSNFEKLSICRPVDRITYIAAQCADKLVLDIGCFDETALVKHGSHHWLHGRICAKAKQVLGIDNSILVPEYGIAIGDNSRIVRGDATKISLDDAGIGSVDVIVAGEFIEHIEDPSLFLSSIKQSFPGKILILSTPNGASASNTLMGMFRREVQHPDHLHNFTFKTLNTMCSRAGFVHWKIVPYHFFATEMILRTGGLTRFYARLAETSIRLIERIFPLLSFGYIVEIDI